MSVTLSPIMKFVIVLTNKKKKSGVGVVYYLSYVYKNNILFVLRHQERKKVINKF
jgi:hypothetical protein